MWSDASRCQTRQRKSWHQALKKNGVSGPSVLEYSTCAADGVEGELNEEKGDGPVPTDLSTSFWRSPNGCP